MPVTLFWSRFRDDMDADAMRTYQADADRIGVLAESSAGFVSIKRYTADDGERLSVVLFETEQQQAAFGDLAGHRAAQRRGRDTYYRSYRLTDPTG